MLMTVAPENDAYVLCHAADPGSHGLSCGSGEGSRGTWSASKWPHEAHRVPCTEHPQRHANRLGHGGAPGLGQGKEPPNQNKNKNERPNREMYHFDGI